MECGARISVWNTGFWHDAFGVSWNSQKPCTFMFEAPQTSRVPLQWWRIWRSLSEASEFRNERRLQTFQVSCCVFSFLLCLVGYRPFKIVANLPPVTHAVVFQHLFSQFGSKAILAAPLFDCDQHGFFWGRRLLRTWQSFQGPAYQVDDLVGCLQNWKAHSQFRSEYWFRSFVVHQINHFLSLYHTFSELMAHLPSQRLRIAGCCSCSMSAAFPWQRQWNCWTRVASSYPNVKQMTSNRIFEQSFLFGPKFFEHI